MVDFKIFRVQVTNQYASISPCNSDAAAAQEQLNTISLLSTWEIRDYEFWTSNDTSDIAIPDISFVRSGLAFRSFLKDKIFPRPCKDLEFLPIRVNGDSWTILNCLKTTSAYDVDESVFYRSLDNKIFLVNHLVISDSTLSACEVFVLDDSNRATLYALHSLADRINRLGLHGITFKEIGFLLG
jgi:hypothetical protein